MRPIDRLHALLDLHKAAMEYWSGSGRPPEDQGWKPYTYKRGPKKGQSTFAREKGAGRGRRKEAPAEESPPARKPKGKKASAGWTPPAGHPAAGHPPGTLARLVGDETVIEPAENVSVNGVWALWSDPDRRYRHRQHKIIHRPSGLQLHEFGSQAVARAALRNLGEKAKDWGADESFGEVKGNQRTLPEEHHGGSYGFEAFNRNREREDKYARDEEAHAESQRLQELNSDPVAVARNPAPKGYHKTASLQGEDGQPRAQLVKTVGAAGQYVISKRQKYEPPKGRGKTKGITYDEYVVTHGPSGMKVFAYPSLGQARALAKHLHEHAPNVGKDVRLGESPSEEELDVLREAWMAMRKGRSARMRWALRMLRHLER